MRIDGVDGADVPGVEVDGIVQEEIDLLQLFLLDVDHRVRELAELARVVPVRVTQHDPNDLLGIETDGRHLVADGLPAAGGVPVEDVGQLLPAGVVQRRFAVRILDDPHVDRQVDRGVEARLVRLECAERHAHEPAALDDPRRVQRAPARRAPRRAAGCPCSRSRSARPAAAAGCWVWPAERQRCTRPPTTKRKTDIITTRNSVRDMKRLLTTHALDRCTTVPLWCRATPD